MKDSRIAIGTLIQGSENPAGTIRRLSSLGFECFSLTFWETVGAFDLSHLADEVRKATEETGTWISAVGVYGNPLRGDATGEETVSSFHALLEAAPALGSPVVSCFAGRVPGSSVPDSLEPWRRVFSPLAERAESLDLKIAFENCRLGDTWKTGKWNLAINPDAWALMFDALPSVALGLEWEPCHQVEALADPLFQLEAWLTRIVHLHGKDARVNRRTLAEKGIYAKTRWAESCFPGNGDTDWGELFQLLVRKGYSGTLDIEGWNDKDWEGERELDGQKRALAYLKKCRG